MIIGRIQDMGRRCSRPEDCFIGVRGLSYQGVPVLGKTMKRERLRLVTGVFFPEAVRKVAIQIPFRKVEQVVRDFLDDRPQFKRRHP